jgi:L-fuculose-phosphate aldolase
MTEKSSDELALREQLTEQYRHIVTIGLNELASGNISSRVGEGMIISPTGATIENIEPGAMVKMTLDGEWEGDNRPSTEWRMHAAIYKEFPRANAVVHTHSDHCVALACHEMKLPGFHYLVGVFGGNDVPCVPYYTFGTEELGNAAAEALKTRTACLLGNHGMICRGRSIASAVSTAHRLEIMCRQYLLTRQLGEPMLLTDQNWKDFFERGQQIATGTYI